MKYYSVSVSDDYGWIMYYGQAPMFDWLVDFLRDRVPGMSDHSVRESADAVHLYLPELPAPLYRQVLEVLAHQAAPAAQEAVRTTLNGVYPVSDGWDRAVPAVGDVKTIALISRRVLTRGR
ncbi:hypothetical protein [Kitasatospora sp. MAP5-34]|uniref:hypothetical protein n=1 Tax=Kitasatospora sp. MAP5-34 TaxID=3035102 RepID=UPI002473720C|nr:hypothetical protein [Kitasatospora sp. MAP5-34]MDH6575702.1 hypothetical protein [Kitasatospora sp. MAP5-34]